MRVVPVDQYNNLFLIENIVPAHIVEEILRINWFAQPWQREDLQEDWTRRKIVDTQIVMELDYYLRSILPLIGEACGVTFVDCASNMWLDDTELVVPPHCDHPGLVAAMQLYWGGSFDELGTEFYNDPNGESLRYKCPYLVNTGYLMFNGATQWHGIMRTMQPGAYRLSSYTRFSAYINSYGELIAAPLFQDMRY